MPIMSEDILDVSDRALERVVEDVARGSAGLEKEHPECAEAARRVVEAAKAVREKIRGGIREAKKNADAANPVADVRITRGALAPSGKCAATRSLPLVASQYIAPNHVRAPKSRITCLGFMFTLQFDKIRRAGYFEVSHNLSSWGDWNDSCCPRSATATASVCSHGRPWRTSS